MFFSKEINRQKNVKHLLLNQTFSTHVGKINFSERKFEEMH